SVPCEGAGLAGRSVDLEDRAGGVQVTGDQQGPGVGPFEVARGEVAELGRDRLTAVESADLQARQARLGGGGERGADVDEPRPVGREGRGGELRLVIRGEQRGALAGGDVEQHEIAASLTASDAARPRG